MFYVTLIFLFVSFLFTYRSKTYEATLYLYGAIVGWILSLIVFMLYMSKFNYYYNYAHNFFDFHKDVWNRLVLVNFDTDLLIRLFNGGILLFRYALLCYTISLTLRPRSKRVYRRAVILLAFVSMMQWLYYDPLTNRSLFDLDSDWHMFTSNLHIVFKGINYFYLLLAVYLLLHHYFTHPKIKILQHYNLYRMLCFIPIIVIHLLIFSWAPKILVKPTLIDQHYEYMIPDIGFVILFFDKVPYIVYVSFFLIVFAIYKYNSLESRYKKQNTQINRNIDTAVLGIRAFAHSMKNHTLAIRFEAEHLLEKYHKDPETQYSLQLILDSCTQSFQTIEAAAQKLKKIRLQLQKCKLNAPVYAAVSRFSHIQDRILVRIHVDRDPPCVYMDEGQMTEVIHNLVENAIDSIPDKGTIDIRVEQSGGWGVITVSDSGSGMEEEMLGNIFTPFFSTKPSLSNWGVGLSFCHMIVNAHDGKITVDSNRAQGTVFKVLLPII